MNGLKVERATGQMSNQDIFDYFQVTSGDFPRIMLFNFVPMPISLHFVKFAKLYLFTVPVPTMDDIIQ